MMPLELIAASHVWLFCGIVPQSMWIVYKRARWCQHVERGDGDPRCAICGRIPSDGDYEYFVA